MSETNFINGLNHLRNDCDEAAQYLYAYLATYKAINDSPEIYNALNRSPRYWSTILSSLQTAKFIALGRIFDSNGSYGVVHIIQMARQNISMFNRESLRRRKLLQLKNSPIWVDSYINDAYVPNVKDFDRLMRYAKKYKSVYETRCREIRSQVFAHNVVTKPDKVNGLFAKTNYRHLARLLAFVDSVHKLLTELFYNGRLGHLRLGRPNRLPDSLLKGDWVPATYIGFQMMEACNGFLYDYLTKKPATDAS